MVITMVTRFANIRCVKNVNNFTSIGNAISVIQCSSILSKPYSTVKDDIAVNLDKQLNKKVIHKSMKVYFQQANEYKEFIQKQIAEYDIGKRHLANMMGEDPDNFSQADINRSIRYLFPSGLYEPEALPMMVHPSKLYERKKEAEFDESGRPHHFLFYTTKPNYYEVLHQIAKNINKLDKLEEQNLSLRISTNEEGKYDDSTTEWLSKTELEEKLLEQISDAEYEYFIASIKRLYEHNLSKHASAFLENCRKQLTVISTTTSVQQVEYDENKRPYILLANCIRKSAKGTVKVTSHGSGNITINGDDISYFKDIQCREQYLIDNVILKM